MKGPTLPGMEKVLLPEGHGKMDHQISGHLSIQSLRPSRLYVMAVRWSISPEPRPSLSHDFHSLLSPTGRWTARCDLKSLRLDSEKSFLACVCCQVGPSASSPSPVVYQVISIVSPSTGRRCVWIHGNQQCPVLFPFSSAFGEDTKT
jgi:hypothetical protein